MIDKVYTIKTHNDIVDLFLYAAFMMPPSLAQTLIFRSLASSLRTVQLPDRSGVIFVYRSDLSYRYMTVF